MLKIICEREGCQREAQWAPKLCIPPTGFPHSKSDMSFMMDVKLCLEHAVEFGASIDFDDPGNAMLRRGAEALATSKVPPDFKRITSEPVRLNSAEYAMFGKARARSATG